MRRGSSFIPTVRSAPEWAYAFTGSCAVGRSRALPPIRELHPCPEDHHKTISSLAAIGRSLSGRQLMSDDHLDALHLVVADPVRVPRRRQRLNVPGRVRRPAAQLELTRLIGVPHVTP